MNFVPYKTEKKNFYDLDHDTNWRDQKSNLQQLIANSNGMKILAFG